MYREFFGLERKPFELLPNPEFLYLSAAHKKALNYLRYGIQEGTGFILFTGEVGSGKTTIIKEMLGSLKEEFVPSVVFNTMVDPEQLLSLISEDFGIDSGGRGKVELLRMLHDFFIERCAEGKRPVIIIDEAQNLTPAALEEVRLLSNLEGTDTRLLQTILVGQPELREKVTRPEMLQLRQRISINCHLRKLELDEVKQYILFRLEKAGNRDAVTFEDGTFEVIHGFSGGTPRLINVCCDFSLLAAYVDGSRVLTPTLVKEVIADIGIAEETPRSEGGHSGNKAYNGILENMESRRETLLKIGEKLDRLEQAFKKLYHHFDTRVGHLEDSREMAEEAETAAEEEAGRDDKVSAD